MFDAKLCRINRSAVQLVQTHTFSLSLSLWLALCPSFPPYILTNLHATRTHTTSSSSFPCYLSISSPPLPCVDAQELDKSSQKDGNCALIDFLPLNWVLISSCHAHVQGRIFVLRGKGVSCTPLMRNNMSHQARFFRRRRIVGHPDRFYGRQSCTWYTHTLYLKSALHTNQIVGDGLQKIELVAKSALKTLRNILR